MKFNDRAYAPRRPVYRTYESSVRSRLSPRRYLPRAFTESLLTRSLSAAGSTFIFPVKRESPREYTTTGGVRFPSAARLERRPTEHACDRVK